MCHCCTGRPLLWSVEEVFCHISILFIRQEGTAVWIRDVLQPPSQLAFYFVWLQRFFLPQLLYQNVSWNIIFEAWLLLLSQKTNPWRAGPAEIQRKNQQKSCWKNEEIFRDRSVSNLTTSSAICHTDLDVQAG